MEDSNSKSTDLRDLFSVVNVKTIMTQRRYSSSMGQEDIWMGISNVASNSDSLEFSYRKNPQNRFHEERDWITDNQHMGNSLSPLTSVFDLLIIHKFSASQSPCLQQFHKRIWVRTYEWIGTTSKKSNATKHGCIHAHIQTVKTRKKIFSSNCRIVCYLFTFLGNMAGGQCQYIMFSLKSDIEKKNYK